MSIEMHLKGLSPGEIQRDFVLAEGYKGPNGFIPSCGDTTTVSYRFGDYTLGYASLRVRFGQTVVWDHFYPLEHARGLVGQKTGIGTLAHVKALDHLGSQMHIFDDATVVHSRVMGPRKKHLAAMGVGHGMSFRDYADASRRYAERKGFVFD